MDFCEEIEQRISEILDEDDLLGEKLSEVGYYKVEKSENNEGYDITYIDGKDFEEGQDYDFKIVKIGKSGTNSVYNVYDKNGEQITQTPKILQKIKRQLMKKGTVNDFITASDIIFYDENGDKTTEEKAKYRAEKIDKKIEYHWYYKLILISENKVIKDEICKNKIKSYIIALEKGTAKGLLNICGIPYHNNSGYYVFSDTIRLVPHTFDNYRTQIEDQLQELKNNGQEIGPEDVQRIYNSIIKKQKSPEEKKKEEMENLKTFIKDNEKYLDEELPDLDIMNLKELRDLKDKIVTNDDYIKDYKSAATKKEYDIANSVDKWIKKDNDNLKNPRIDSVLDKDNKKDHFYSVRDGKSTKSDIVVVHDKTKFNPNSNEPVPPDKDFYIEAKLSEQARSFSPSIQIVGNKDNLKFEYHGWFEKQNSEETEIIDDKINEEDKEEFQYKEMIKNIDIGEQITELVEQTDESKAIINTFQEILSLYKKVNESSSGQYVFPRDFEKFPSIFDFTVDSVIKNKNEKIQKYMMDFFNKKYKKDKIHNFEDLKNITNQQKTTMLVYFIVDKLTGRKSLDIFYGKITDVEGLKKLGDLITYWYSDKKDTAYIEIGPNEHNPGGIYIFKREFDPLNLQKKFQDKIKTFTESIIDAGYIIRRNHNKKADSFVVNFTLKLDGNGLQFEDILNVDNKSVLKMKKGDTEHDDSKFFNPVK